MGDLPTDGVPVIGWVVQKIVQHHMCFFHLNGVIIRQTGFRKVGRHVFTLAFGLFAVVHARQRELPSDATQRRREISNSCID